MKCPYRRRSNRSHHSDLSHLADRSHRARARSSVSIVALSIFAIALAACSGSDGATGPQGPPGSPGGSGPTDTTLAQGDSPSGVNVAIVSVLGASGSDGTFQVGDHPKVTFTLKKGDGTAWMLSEMSSARFLFSGPSFNYQRVLDQVSDVATASVANADGSFTYTFANAIPSQYLAPYNTTSPGTDDGDLSGQALLAGTYTLGGYFSWKFTVDGQSATDAGNAEADVLFGGATAITPREVAKNDNCNQCHTSLRAHGGSRRDVKLCLLCHTAGSTDGDQVSIDFKVMIHKIHNGEHLPSVLGVNTKSDGTRDYAAAPTPYVVGGTDFSAVAFPVWPSLNIAMPRDMGYSALTSQQKAQEDTIRTGVTACAKCHGDPDGAGPLTAPAQGDLYKAQPARQTCGSCHDDVVWGHPYTANGQTMGPQANNSNCVLCHATSGTPIAVQDAHTHPLNNSSLNPGVNFVGNTISGGSGAGGRFLAGDKPLMTFQVKDDSGADVPLATLDSASSILVGPTSNRQAVFPYTGPNNISYSPYDFSGRLAAASTSNKGTLSRVRLTGTPVTEVLTVEFTSATAFTVTGSVSGNLGASALAVDPSTNPSGSSISAIDLGPNAVAETITIAFTTSVDFSVTGSVSGPLGSGKLPAPLSGSVRFDDANGKFSFTISSGSTAFAAGNSIFATVFKGAAANPLLFAIAAGRTAFAATDRFYYEVIAPSSSYMLHLPMELSLEFLGDGNNTVGQALVAGNLPVYFGRQTLFEVTAVAPRTALAAATKPLDRFADVASTTNFAINDYCVLDGASGVGVREYLQVGLVDGNRLWFKAPVRYAHAAGTTADEPTLTYRQEGASNRYTLNAATGTVTSVAAFGNGNGIVLTYRTDGRFGFLRHNGDALQAFYTPPMNDTPDLGQDWAEWCGLPYLDGTYTASVWGQRNLNLALYGEVQQYRLASTGANVDFLYGAGSTTIEPYAFISSSQNCYACHDQLLFHGGGRSGFDTCLLCHGVSGGEDWAQYNPPSGSNATAPDNGVTVSFRTMLHKIHRGADLANASTYTVYGNGASPSKYDEVEFPSLPQGVRNCTVCHGSATAWMEPSPRTHPMQTIPTRAWRAECNACHDSASATAHIDVMTSPSGVESCEVCHGPDGQWAVQRMHKSY
jgi:OmcA/MtrC family decaheme c-type cytochrome